MTISDIKPGEGVKDVHFTEDTLSVDLIDGRIVVVPLAWYPRLLYATPEQRANWQICGGGYGIHWPDIDEDLSTEGLLRGAPAPRRAVMGSIRKQLEISGGLGKRECDVLFDTSVSACFIREDVAQLLAPVVSTPTSLAFATGNGSVVRAEQAAVLNAALDGHLLFHTFLIVPHLPVEVIIGADFLQRWKIGFDPATEEFIIDEKALEILLV